MIGPWTDDFEIIEALREDISGTVYRAQQRSLQRTVAIKILHADGLDAGELQRFSARSQLLARLRHPNVAQVYSLGVHDGVHYLVTEFVPGKSLRQIIAEKQAASEERIAIMADVAGGLQAIHELGVVHGDLSTDSILVMDGTAKICDLGIAVRVNASSRSSRNHDILGHMEYVSPEQIAGESLTSASDVFSFGTILHELLLERHPFKADHPMESLYNIVHREPVSPDGWAGSALLDLARHCLAKKPSARPSIRDAASILQSVRPGSSSSPSASREVAATPRASNPYLNRTMIRRPEQFFGRTREIRRLYALLDADPPGSASIVGDRRIGKSSLLNYVYHPVNRQRHFRQPERIVMVFLDLQQKDMTVQEFAELLIGTVSLEGGDELDLKTCTHDLDGIRDMVIRIQKAGKRLVVILDEFERVVGNPAFPLEFYSFLRFLANHYDVAYLTSSMRDLPALCHDKTISDSPFFNIFTTIRLAALRPAEAQELIRVPSEAAGGSLAPYSAQILQAAGGFPFFIQIACAHAFEMIVAGQQFDGEEVVRCLAQEAQPHYENLWERLDESDLKVLAHVAMEKAVPETLQHVLEGLVLRDYVLKEPPSDVRITSSTFRDFIARTCVRKVRKRNVRSLPTVAVGTALVALLAVLVVSFRQEPPVPPGTKGVKVTQEYARRMASGEKIGLHLLSIGVSRYREQEHGLQFAANDAKGIAAAFQEQRAIFRVASRVLVDEEASKASITKALAALRDSATQHDLVVLSLSGHGRIDLNETFFFLPYDFDSTQELSVSAISKNDLLAYLGKMPCPVLLLMDTCHSGEMARGEFKGASVEDGVARAIASAVSDFSAAEAGIVVMAACLSREKAQENVLWGHGALTLAFLEGLLGKRLYTDRASTPLPQQVSADAIINLHDVDYYVTKRVRELVGGDQRVKSYNPSEISLLQIPMAVRAQPPGGS